MKRRTFIEKASISTVGMVTAFHIPSFAQNRKLKIGLIGCGWYGMVITTAALKTGSVEVIAVCDVDSEHLKSSADEIEKLQGSRPKEIKDYQDLLDLKKVKDLMLLIKCQVCINLKVMLIITDGMMAIFLKLLSKN